MNGRKGFRLSFPLPAILALAVALLAGCRSVAPPVASPVANGPPGPTPHIGSGPPQSAPPPAPSNEDRVVAQAVRASIKQDPAIAGGTEAIQVKVKKGVVTLRGTLPAAADRAALLARLEKLPGVDRIEDELK